MTGSSLLVAINTLLRVTRKAVFAGLPAAHAIIIVNHSGCFASIGLICPQSGYD
ncbi:MAG: hypothetical protein ROW52_02680 [Anaerolineaceae bacterium]